MDIVPWIKSELFKNATCAIVSVHRTGFLNDATYFRKSDMTNRKRDSVFLRTHWFCIGNNVLPKEMDIIYTATKEPRRRKFVSLCSQLYKRNCYIIPHHYQPGGSTIRYKLWKY